MAKRINGTCKVCGKQTFTMVDDGKWSIEGLPVYICDCCNLEYYEKEIGGM